MGSGGVDLALVDFEALGFERIGNVAGGDRAEELIVFAGLAREAELDTVQSRGVLFARLPFRWRFFSPAKRESFRWLSDCRRWLRRRACAATKNCARNRA